MKSYLLTIVMALFAMSVVIARPAYPGLLYATLEDGTHVAYHMVGDEFSHAYLTLDGRYIERVADLQAVANAATLSEDTELWRYVEAPLSSAENSPLKNSQARANRRPASDNPYTDFPTIGEVRGLVLMVEYTDVEFQPEHTQELFQRQLNEEGYSDYRATGSARDYFIAQSMGQFRPQFDVVGPCKLPHAMAYYGGNSMGGDKRPGEMVTDACRYAHDSLGIDFSQYDYDQNGDVDFVFVLYAGYGENYGASPNTIWPHMSTLRDQRIYFDLDGVNVNLYACSCELNGRRGTELDGIGAVCHEFGHVLGLPDVYNTRNQGQVQLGQWDVMDSGSYNNDSRTPPSYTAFERVQLGWMELIELTDPVDSVFVPEITQSNIAYRISTNEPDEFFTLENHQQVGWDAPQGGRGLMIIHVDYDRSLWDADAINASNHPHYDLIEADGTAGRTYETDLYPTPSNNRFTDYSTPASSTWRGKPLESGVTHITQHDNGTISFRFKNDRLNCPQVLPATDLTTTSFRVNWTSVEGAIGYRIHMYEELADSLNDLILAENFSLATSGEYPKSSSENIAPNIDKYVHTTGWSGQDIFQCGGMIRLGGYGYSGKISTPLFETSKSDSISVSLFCCAYTGKSVNYTIELLDAESNILQADTLKADRNMQTPIVHYGQLPSQYHIRIVSQKERLFIDDLRIVHGQRDSLSIWTAGPQQWDIECEGEAIDADFEFASTDDTDATVILSHQISDLEPGLTYHYNITALDPEPFCQSLPTETVDVTLPLTDGIHSIQADSVTDGIVHDLQGRIVGTAHAHQALPSGLYLINGQKILIR